MILVTLSGICALTGGACLIWSLSRAKHAEVHRVHNYYADWVSLTSAHTLAVVSAVAFLSAYVLALAPDLIRSTR